ncbi:MAG TPA: DUF4912 domain-containing protein [Polyangiaceae bacterium]|nr:DUF4912 domain-containing protein [Polyangiaceae bacterium]
MAPTRADRRRRGGAAATPAPPPMDRPSFETLSRDELIARARASGVARPEVLTRAELVDELLRRSSADAPTRARARGFFGRARDLIATVIERGLHLPEAAQRIRNPVPVDEDPAPPAPVATVTLAEIYAAQGHLERALSVLDELLRSEPDHAQARALSSRLRTGPAPTPSPEDPRPAEGPPGELGSSPAADLAAAQAEVEVAALGESEPPGPGKRPMLDDAPLPERYDVDEAVVMPVDPTTAFVYWELREATLARARQLAPQGRLAIRLFVETATWEGVVSMTRDILADAAVGDYFVFGLPEGAVLRASIGWLVGESFQPVATGPAYHAPPGGPSRLVATTLVRWTPDAAAPPAPVEPPPALADALATVQGAPPRRVAQLPSHLPLTSPRQRRWASAEEVPPGWAWDDELDDWVPIGSSEQRPRSGEGPPGEGPLGASEQWGVRFLGKRAQLTRRPGRGVGMRQLLALPLALLALLACPPAFAQPKPPPAAETHLDLEGEPVDPDDLAPALRRSTERGLTRAAPVQLSLLAWHQEALPLARDRGFGLVLTLPLERLLGPPPPPPPPLGPSAAGPASPAAPPPEPALGPAAPPATPLRPAAPFQPAALAAAPFQPAAPLLQPAALAAAPLLQPAALPATPLPQPAALAAAPLLQPAALAAAPLPQPAALPFERARGPAARPALPPGPAPADAPGPAPAAFSGDPAHGAAPAALRVSPEQMSALSHAALRAAGLAGGVDARLDGIAARARASALLPELRLRALQNNDQALRLSYADADPYRTQTSGGSALLLEARATFRLDRLLYADDEVAVERLRGDVREQRQRLLLKLAEAVGAWQRAQAALFDPDASPRERAAALGQAAGASALLDALSAGAWSRLRGRDAGAAPER